MGQKLLVACLTMLAGMRSFGGNVLLNLMPMPAKVTFGDGFLPIDENFSVAVKGSVEPRITAAVERLLRRLSKQTHLALSGQKPIGATTATLVIDCGPGAEDESYGLGITATQARLTARTALGVLHGIETFLQLVQSADRRFSVPVLSIDDKPRFSWRGLHLDVSRHWMPLDVVLRNLDGMTAVKLNVFHWHLSDDQGFRVESKVFPKLHGMGSDGQYYTQDQVRQVVAYARERGIRVVPEFDMPAHTTAWFVGYPELASAPGPYEIGRTWGIFAPAIDPTRESTYNFLDRFIGEMAGLFPDPYFHIGGDEVNGQQWNASAEIQEFKKREGLDNHGIQAHFNRRVQAIVTKYGKRMEGWDEILDPDLSKGIVIQSWRGQRSLAQAARLGYDGILSAGYYLDLMHSAAEHYAVDPMDKDSAGLTPRQQQHILGGEAAMWVEFATPENVDSRIWPRTAAIAERFWSPRTLKDPVDMYRRLEVVSEWLDSLGLQHRANYLPMLRRLAGSNTVEPVKTLADICEPVKEYVRARTRKYTQQTPLNRMVDTVRPESDTARHFNALSRKDQRTWLIKWRDNDANLQPILQRSPLLGEVAPVSAHVMRLAMLGLQALDYLESGRKAPAAWVAEQRVFLASLKRGEAELLISIAPAIDRLVLSASGRTG